MCEEDSSMLRSWSELPMSALVLAFGKLPLSDRAGTEDCVARVCSSWAEAAAAATVTIDLQDCPDTSSLQQWLQSRGLSVRKMDVRSTSGVIASLPCPKLEDLEFKDSIVDLRPGSQLLLDLCAATALSRLCFCDVTFEGEPDMAAVLLALPNLKGFGQRSLKQEQCIKVQDSSQQQQQLQVSTASEVQHSDEPSQNLWSVHGDPLVRYKCFTDSGMQLICKLTKLQLLELGSLQGVTAAGLAGLADLQRLDDLTLEDLTVDISLSAVPAFSQLTALTGLVLSWAFETPFQTSSQKFDPSVLAHMTQLEWLQLSACTAARGKAGAAELLSRLSQLPQLNVLALEHVRGLQDCPPESFSSLTSSSVLKDLTFHSMWLQPGPWQHMFPDTQLKSALTELDFRKAMPWEPADLDRLVSSCCQLEGLSLWCSQSLQLTPLLQLTVLKRLLLRGVTENSTAASLVQLSALQSLQELIVVDPCIFTDCDAVRSLTALTQLTRFGLSGSNGVFSTTTMRRFDLQKVYERHATFYAITSTAPDGAPPDVWSQLLSCCEAFAPAAQQHMGALEGATSSGRATT